MADLIAALATAAGAGPTAETDPNFNQTVLLLHGDGTDGAQNNTFLDSSTNNFTITRNGNTTQGTFSPFSVAEGQWSAYFDGTNDYISVPDSTDFTMGNGDWTIEAWIYSTRSGTTEIIWGNANSAGSGSSTAFQLYKVSNKIIAFVYAGANKDVTSTADCPLNQWFHVAMVRDGTNLRLYVNGVEAASPTDLSTTALVDSADPVAVGRSGSYNASYFQGYVSNFSIIKGTCLYPSGTTFTPPSSPLSTSTSGQSVLLCTANRFIDTNTATTAKTVTVAGPLIQPFSPFAPSAAYSPSVNGGSGYFDGTGDYLTVPNNTDLILGTGDCTIECWVYPLAVNAGNANPILNKLNGASNNGWLLGMSNTSLWQFSTGANVIVRAGTVVLNAWTHLSAVRASGTTTLYVNGVSVGTTASVFDFTDTVDLFVGFNSSFVAVNAYVSNARIIKGTAITPPVGGPTAPVTAVSGTELLLNFTNAGIFDNTGKNNLETVGNAQIDTSVKKYGTGSMEFDGTGDWLLLANNVNQQLGTGNFTIEFWVYLATGDTGSNRGLVAKGTSTTGFLVSLNTTEKVVFTFATSTITSTGAITLDAWNHIAVVREGTGSNETKIYIAGTNDGTGTVSTDFNQTSVMYVGANRTGGDPMKGYIDDLRITKGVARYTTTFTPPTKAFPDQ